MLLARSLQGYLMDSKQIIAFAKWYLSNPLATKSDFKLSPYSQDDIYNTQEIIQKAKHNPKMLAFRKGTYHSVLGNDMPDGLHVATFHPRKHSESEISIHDYLKYLRKQTLVNWNTVVAYTKAVNQRIIRKAHKLNQIITKVAKDSDTRVQYKKFINNKYGLDSIYSEFSRGLNGCGDKYIDYDKLNGLALIHHKIMFLFHYDRRRDKITPQQYMKRHHIKPEKVKVNVYDKLAFFAYLKWELPYIDIESFYPMKCFKNDVNPINLAKHNTYVLFSRNVKTDAKYVTDWHELIDYKRFIKKP